MPFYPGTPPPEISPLCTIEEIGFAETNLKIYSHTGTHIDAPAHMFAGGKTLDQYDISYFCGSGLIIDCRSVEQITRDMVENKVNLSGSTPDYVILFTGWSEKWFSPLYYQDFPVMSDDCAEYIASLGGRGVGVDAISVDKVEAEVLHIHDILFKKEMIIIENLTNLDELYEKSHNTQGRFEFNAIPLKIKDIDGSPARAWAKI